MLFNSKRKNYYTIVGITVFFCLIFLTVVWYWQKDTPFSQAQGNGIPIRGWTWTENFGWISFQGSNYGVGYDSDSNRFNGYAWSEYVGWIKFSPDEAGDGSCPTAPACNAYYDANNHQLAGWAKVLTLGDYGWLSLRDTNYSVNVIDDDTKQWTNDPAGCNNGTNCDGDFTGWAWNGNDTNFDKSGLGWVSFNCLSGGNCASSKYWVTGRPETPVISGVTPTLGRSSSSLTIKWNAIAGEQSFELLRKNGGDSNDLNLYSSVASMAADTALKEDDGLAFGQTYSYRIKANNVFGSNISGARQGTTSPIDYIDQPNTDIAGFCYAGDSMAKIKLKWAQPSFDGNYVDSIYYKIEYCVIDETTKNCDNAGWQTPIDGDCSGNIAQGTLACEDNLTNVNNRWPKRYNLHQYRIQALSANKVCYDNEDGYINGLTCASDNDCIPPLNNYDSCRAYENSRSNFRQVRPCPRRSQPEYEEVRPQ